MYYRDVIEVGRGPYVGEDVVMHWNSSTSTDNHNVNSLGFLTDGVDGIWKFSPIPGLLSIIKVYGHFRKYSLDIDCRECTLLILRFLTFLTLTCAEGEYTYTTTSQYSFNRHWIFTRRSYITFSVQSCTSAIVLLAETPGSTETRYYEITIGLFENTKVSIFDSDNSGDIADMEIADLLNCDEFRKFWISWTFNNGK